MRVLIKTEMLMSAVSRERSNSDTDPLSGAFIVLCRIKLNRREHCDYIRNIHKTSIKISRSSEGTFYNNWKRNDAEQIASLCIVIHGLIGIFLSVSLLVHMCWRRGSNGAVRP